MYEWAGILRTINISKGDTAFALAPYIETEARKLSAALASENYLQGLDKPQFIERFAHYYAEWNVLHPLREGNGRATREWLVQLARAAGYEFDQTRIDNSNQQWDHAAERSFYELYRLIDRVDDPEWVTMSAANRVSRRTGGTGRLPSRNLSSGAGLTLPACCARGRASGRLASRQPQDRATRSQTRR